MKKWSKKKKITILLLFLVLLVLFAGLCWKKRRGIYNTYMKLTNQEIPYSVKEKWIYMGLSHGYSQPISDFPINCSSTF